MSYSQPPIKVIIFDFMGVLLFKRPDYRPDEMVDEIDRLIGIVTDDILFKQEVIKKYRLSEAEFQAILDKIVDKYEPLIPLWDMLPELKKKYRLVIVNNGTSLTLQRFKDKYRLNDIFGLFVSSALEGLKKPDDNIYQRVIQRLGVKPKECLFMDDSLLNIEGAQKCGLVTIHWQDAASGLAQFQEFINL